MKALMSKLPVLLSTFFLLASAAALAAPKAAQPAPDTLSAYLKIQEALASDSLEGVSAAASKIAQKEKLEGLKTPAQGLINAKSLEEARGHFKTLSATMDSWAKKKMPKGVSRVSCPMANASWLQKPGPIQNPYYGKQMLSCGEIQK